MGAVRSRAVFVYASRFGSTIENIFVTSTELKHRFGADFDAIPARVHVSSLRVDTSLRRMLLFRRIDLQRCSRKSGGTGIYDCVQS